MVVFCLYSSLDGCEERSLRCRHVASLRSGALAYWVELGRAEPAAVAALGASGDLKPLLARLARVVELGSSDQAT